jgi:pyrroloquinoline quinone (PQQ) biosynthesis protein C
MSIEAVLHGKTLSTQEFCDVLVNEVKNGHARLHHPFYLALYDGKLSLDEIRVWAKEAWGIFAYNVAINTAKLVRCQLSGIHDPHIHKKFVEIIQSEVGYQYFEGTPRRVPGHRALFLRFGESIGIPASELERSERENDFLPMTMLARAGWVDIALRSDSIGASRLDKLLQRILQSADRRLVLQGVQESLQPERGRHRILRRTWRGGHGAQQYRL